MTSFDTFQKKALLIANATGVDLPTSYYRYSFRACWKCKKEILVFTWPEHDLFPDSSPGKLPVPKTLRNEFSNSVEESYWVNTCPYCKNIQGDFYQYMEPDGPFFSFECGEDTEYGFKADLVTLADYANEIGLM